MPDGQAGEVTCIAPNQDVFPTLLDAMGLPPREGVDGVTLTQGCPGLAVSQLWSDETKLDVLSVSDDRVRIERSCKENTEVGWDLVADPLQASPQPPARLDPTGALRAALEAAWTRIEPAYPDSHCALE
jgi:hypothetical protein